MATDKQPGVQSYYLVIANIQAAKAKLAEMTNVTQAVKDIISHKTKRSVYIWWSDNITRTASGALVLEIPRGFLKAQTWLKSRFPNIIYDRITIKPLMPAGEIQ